MWTDFLEICRWLIIFLGLVNLTWLMVRISAHWEVYPSWTQRGMSLTLAMFVLAATYGSAEGVIRELAVGSRSLIVVIAQVSLTFLLYETRGRTLFNPGITRREK